MRLFAEDARLILRKLPTASLDRAFILFPDPWPKKRHRKRRLFNDDLVTAISKALVPDGRLCLATDFHEYYDVMRSLVDADGSFERLLAYEWRGTGGVTNFEKKYLATGRTSYRAAYRKRSVDREWSRL